MCEAVGLTPGHCAGVRDSVWREVVGERGGERCLQAAQTWGRLVGSGVDR